jgi:hypothetical protein
MRQHNGISSFELIFCIIIEFQAGPPGEHPFCAALRRRKMKN